MKTTKTRVPALAAGAALAAALLVCATDGRADQVEISSSFNPVGSGARAVGMGGAFISVADDATAASWNPAGLVQLEKPEFSVVYGYANRDQSYNSALHPELQGSHDMDASGINYASFAYPFTLKKNMVVSINYQRMFDMNKSLNSFNLNYDNQLGGGDTLHTSNHFSQKGYLSALTPAFAIQVIPELYLGVAVNIWDDFMGTSSWESTLSTTGTGSIGGNPVGVDSTTHSKYSFSGVNTTSGFLVNLNKLSIGGVFKSPFSGTVKVDSTTTDTGVTSSSSSKNTLDMPMSAGLGVSYRCSDAWLVGLDGYWTQWSKFKQTLATGDQINPITLQPLSAGKLGDTYQVRLGTEYLIMRGKNVIPLRAGVFYDPQPKTGGHDDFYGFSAGSGYTWENYSFDLAYQFRHGHNVSSDIPMDDITTDITEHNVLASVIYRF